LGCSLDDEDPDQTEAMVMAMEGADAASDLASSPRPMKQPHCDLAEAIDGWRDKYPKSGQPAGDRGHPARAGRRSAARPGGHRPAR